jgi:hypothetical protein
MSGATRSQCPTCGESFSSVGAFDFHRVGPYLPGRRRCLTALEMLTEGMMRDGNGWWCFDPARAKRPSQADLATRYGSAQQRSERRASA